MNPTDPLFPYKNLFITARPGMGASTVAANILSKYLDRGKKCLVFEATDCCPLTYIERVRIIKEGLDIISLHPWVVEEGDLTIAYDHCFDPKNILEMVEKYTAEVVIYKASRNLRDQRKELINLARELKNRGKIFVFVTQIKGKLRPFTPAASHHRGAIPFFDAAAIIYGSDYYAKRKTVEEEIRIYERGKKKYFAVPVEFDFQHQRIKRK